MCINLCDHSGCNEGRPPGLVEQFTVPGILIPRIPVTNSLPDLKCKVDLQLPKIPYVSFGARCFANAVRFALYF